MPDDIADFLLQTGKPFSGSLLWQLHRDYYQDAGTGAWQAGNVPHYISNNTYIADVYAEIIFAFLKDRNQSHPQNKNRIYLLELGAGSGRLAHHLLKKLQQLCRHAGFDIPPFTYILSDFVPANLSFWMNHPRLKPFEEDGWLDYALFDATTDEDVKLQVAGITLQKHSLDTPLMLIANYFFDSIPQDLFYITEEKLHEGYADLTIPETLRETQGPELMEALQVNYRSSVTKAAGYYADHQLNEILEKYCYNIEQSWLLFPHTALQCLSRLGQISTSGFVLLSSDKGSHRLEDQDHCEPPFIEKHAGCFSLPVNYHAIMAFYEPQGALSLFPQRHYQNINTLCLLMLNNPSDYKETKQAFVQYVERFGPDEFHLRKKQFLQHISEAGIPQIEQCVRLAGFDAELFRQCFPQLLFLLKERTDEEKTSLRTLINKVWDRYYPIGEPQDLAFDIGTLLYQMQYYEDALGYFQISLVSHGSTAPVYYNMAVCHFQLRQDSRVFELITKTLKLDPMHQGVLSLQKQLYRTR